MYIWIIKWYITNIVKKAIEPIVQSSLGDDSIQVTNAIENQQQFYFAEQLIDKLIIQLTNR